MLYDHSGSNSDNCDDCKFIDMMLVLCLASSCKSLYGAFELLSMIWSWPTTPDSIDFSTNIISINDVEMISKQRLFRNHHNRDISNWTERLLNDAIIQLSSPEHCIDSIAISNPAKHADNTCMSTLPSMNLMLQLTCTLPTKVMHTHCRLPDTVQKWSFNHFIGNTAIDCNRDCKHTQTIRQWQKKTVSKAALY